MRRLLFLLVLFIPGLAFADNVSAQKAMKVAESFFANSRTKAGGNLSLVWDGRDIRSVKTRAMSEQQPPFYVFNRKGGGFVIISGEDAINPVIAYSYDNQFSVENMPDNVSYWFDRVRGAVQYVRKNGVKQSAQTTMAWSSLENGNKPDAIPVVEYATALWNQGAPFNNDCPEINGQKCITGCTATATAIVMRYFEHPDHGYGIVPGYTRGSDVGIDVTVPDTKLGCTYNWSKMPLDYNGNWTLEEEKEVSRLMYHCGVIIVANYGLEATSVCIDGKMWADRIIQYFDYDCSGYCFEKSSHPDWLDILKDNIKNIGPTLYGGHDDDRWKGHSFVLDGYDSDGFIRINWGWSGYCNGYYSIEDLSVSGYNFTASQYAILNLRPNTHNIQEVGLLAESESDTDTGLSISKKVLTSTSSFDAYYSGMIANRGNTDFSGVIAIGLENRGGALKWIASPEKQVTIPAHSNMSFRSSWEKCEILKEGESGDKLKLYYRQEGSGVWKALPYDSNPKMTYEIEITVGIPEKPIFHTKINFNKNTEVLKIQAPDGVRVSLTNSLGQDVTNDTRENDSIIEVNKNNLTPGTYTLIISRREESQTILLKL